VRGLVLTALLALFGLPACGRSGLDDYLLSDGGPVQEGAGDLHDGASDVLGPDSAACNATTCPSGCCDATGVCQAGGAITQCGAFGESCQNCSTEGFQLCDPTLHACGNPVAVCDPATCNGCCEGNECLAGTDPNECGLNGEACLHCESSNLACSPQRTCAQPPCGTQTCTGCCFGDECMSGTAPTACGLGGAACANCLATNDQCVAEGTGGVCQGQSTCNTSNCGGCCVGNACVSGHDTTECGAGGQACANCETTGGICLTVSPQGGACEVAGGCSPQNCSGCCFGNACLPGTDPTECGYNGLLCQNCAKDTGTPTCELIGGKGGGICTNYCGRLNCPGCCVGLTCMAGSDPTACGNFGEQCTDCTQLGETCGEPDAGSGAQCINPVCPLAQPPMAAACPEDGVACSYGNCTNCLCIDSAWQCATLSPCP
jgi:hypothetical protein